MENKLYSATYKDKTIKYLKGYNLLSDEEYESIKNSWYEKPKKEDVLKELCLIRLGGTTLSKITKYYFNYLMCDVIKCTDKWSINDTFESKDLLSIVMQKIKDAPDFFAHDSVVRNLEQVFSLGGSCFTHKAAQFPIKEVDFILNKYNVNNNYYDYSCGWGSRLLGAMRNKVNYYGTDPNNLLVDKLEELKEDYKSVNLLNTKVDIRCTGSEEFHKDWEGIMGVAFSSPPYFSLENYKTGNQSYREGTSYESWIDNYLEPTIKNIYKYLIPEGYFICNIKNYDKYTLEEDMVKVAENNGFKLLTVETLKNKSRLGGTQYTKLSEEDRVETNMDENIYVFVKKGFNPKLNEESKKELF